MDAIGLNVQTNRRPAPTRQAKRRLKGEIDAIMLYYSHLWTVKSIFDEQIMRNWRILA
jgi:hypothetical protein